MVQMCSKNQKNIPTLNEKISSLYVKFLRDWYLKITTENYSSLICDDGPKLNQFAFTFSSKRNPIQNSNRIHTEFWKILPKQSVKNQIQNKNQKNLYRIHTEKKQQRTHTDPTPIPHRLRKEVTQNLHRPKTEPTQNPHRLRTEVTQNPHRDHIISPQLPH